MRMGFFTATGFLQCFGNMFRKHWETGGLSCLVDINSDLYPFLQFPSWFRYILGSGDEVVLIKRQQQQVLFPYVSVPVSCFRKDFPPTSFLDFFNLDYNML